MKKLKLGFVGAGYMGQLAHMENYYKLPEVEMVALAEGRKGLAEKVAQRYGIARIYSTHREICEDKEIDAVVAIMPYALNYGVVKDLLFAGKHIITEKPVCLTSEGGREIVQIARDRGLVYQVGYMKRFDPGVIVARDAVREMKANKKFGRLMYLRIWCSYGDWTQMSPPPITTDESPPAYPVDMEKFPGWMSDKQREKVNWWLNFYSHQTNLIRYYLDEDYSFDSAAHGENGTYLLGHSESGITIFMEAFPYIHTLWDEGCRIVFERATVEVKNPAPLARQQAASVRIFRNEGRDSAITEPVVPQVWAFEAQAKQFVDSVLNNSSPVSPASEALKEVELAEDLAKKFFK